MGDSLRTPAMIFGGLLIVFGLISIFLLSRLDDKRIQRCTERTDAVVVKIKQKGKVEDKSAEYVTDFEYTIDDNVQTSRYTLRTDMGMGTKVTLNYNPEDPSEYYIDGIDKNSNNSRITGIIAIAVGLVVVVIAGGIITTRTFGL